jgi:hypothetical protein
MTNLVDRMAGKLKEDYDYISKLDAIFYLRDLYPESTIRQRINAWVIAYPES